MEENSMSTLRKKDANITFIYMKSLHKKIIFIVL